MAHAPTNADSRALPTPAHVLAAYAEPLVSGRRVLILGAFDAALASSLVERGARVVYVLDTAAGPRRSDGRVSVAPYQPADLGARDAAFDVALVPDVGAIGEIDVALTIVRRLLANDGIAVVACQNPDARSPWLLGTTSRRGPSYGEFYDLCALNFAEVRMLGAAPFAAYAVAEFAPEGEPAIAFDPSLVDGAEPPEWFVAIASQRAVPALDPFVVVQVPRDAVSVSLATAERSAPAIAPVVAAPVVDEAARQRAAEETAELRAQLDATSHKLRAAEARAGEEHVHAERLAGDVRTAGVELRKLRDREQRLSQEVDALRARADRLDTDLTHARRAADVAPLREHILQLEGELLQARTQLATPRVDPQQVQRAKDERDRHAAELAAAIDHLAKVERANAETTAASRRYERALDETRHRLADRDKELETVVARARALEAHLVAARAQEVELAALAAVAIDARAQAEASIAIVGKLQAELDAVASTHEHDVSTLELALRARGEELRAAKVELLRRERLVRELVARVEDREIAGAPVGVPVVAAAPHASMVDDTARDAAARQIAELVDTLGRRDRSLEEARRTIEQLTVALDAERAKTEQLARDAARRQAELETAAWRIGELERGKSDAPPPPASPSEIMTELDALRTALAQQTERRRDLERGSSSPDGASQLARAQAAVAERDALIAQLSADVAALRVQRPNGA